MSRPAGFYHTEATKAKMKGRKHSEEELAKMRGHKHSEETKQKLSEAKRGEFNPMYGVSLKREANGNWKGGRRYKDGKDGYVLVHCPDHPCCDRDGYVLEHRLILEEMLGRYLLSTEVSHHLNGIKHDNQPQNLALYNGHSPHMKDHVERRLRDEAGQFVATT